MKKIYLLIFAEIARTGFISLNVIKQLSQKDKCIKFKKASGRLFTIFCILCACGISQNTVAQTANQYTFSTSGTASLAADINGDVVDMTTGTIQLVGANNDDVASAVTNIGFSFTFMGTTYTQFSASSNGVVQLGATAVSGIAQGYAFPISATPMIAPYFGDLETSSSGKVHYKLLGSYPNRTLVVEFLNMGINYSSLTADGTFQVRLYEQTNTIEFVYGAMKINGTTTSTSQKVAIGFSNTTGTNNEFSVNQSTYATTTATTPIINANTSKVAITGLNSSVNGSRRSFTFVPTVAYKSQFISMNTGSSNWCAGETRTVTVTVKNTGTATWTNSAPDINIGIKWNADADYFVRTDANNLAPGATQTYSLIITAPATTGTNNLTFDVVEEGVSWFGNNGGGVGPGNIVYTSPNVTINALPTTVTASGAGTFCGSTTITASNGGSGTIYFQGTTSGGTATTTPSASQVVSASGTYYFRAQSASGCWGIEGSVTVTINALPATVTVSGGGTYCSNPTLTASNGSDGIIYFQGTTSNGTSIATPSTSQVINSSGTYYFRARSAAGCWGTQGSAVVTINSIPTAVTANGAGTFCGSTTITATGGTGGIIYFEGTTSGGTSTATASASQVITSSGTYYFRANSSCGWGTEGSVTVTVNPLPTTVTVSGAGTFCGNTTITAANSSDGTMYFEGTTSNGTSTAIPSASQLITSSGTYYFRAQSALGCWSTQGSAVVVINPLPTAVIASGAGTFCGSTTITAANGGSGTIYFQGTTSGGTSTATASASQIVSASGTYYFRAQSAAGCWGTEGSVTVIINPLPATVTVSGPGTFCNNTTLTAANGLDGTMYFEGNTSNGTSTATPSASQLISSSGTYYFRAQSALGCWSTQGSAVVVINPLPTAVTASGAGTFCGSTTITATNGGGGTIYFEGTTSGGTSTATPSASQLVSTSGTYYFRAQSVAGCWGTEGSATVIINPLPTTVTATGAGTYCSSTTITASNGGSGTIYFQGTTSNGTSTATPSASQVVSATGTYYFRAQSAAGCWGTQGSVAVTTSQTPTIANAGPDQTGTATCGLTTVTLAANTPGIGTGAWSIFSGTGGTITTPSSRTSTFTGIAGNTYVLRWTISNSPCTASTDDVTITFNKPPTATTTTTSVSCFGGSNGTATANPVGGTAPYTYLWSNGQTTQTATGLSANTYSVTVTDSKGCTVAGSATVTQPTQVVADAGPDQTICSGGTTPLGGIPTATGGTGAYTYSWSPATGLSATNVANPTTTPGSTTTYLLIVTDANGCNSAANTVNITIGSGTKTWIGGGTSGGGPDNNFNNLRNWTPAGVPGACNDVVMNFDVSSFCCGTTNTISLSNNVTMNSLSISMSGFVFAQGTNIQRLDAGIYSLSITNATTLSTTASAFLIFGPFENEITVGPGGLVTYGGNLTTTSSSSSDINFPFYATTNNSGKFILKANATLGGVGNDFGNKPAQVIFDGATGVTQTIAQNSGTQAILLGVTSTDIGQTNSPKLVLAGAGTGGFQSIGDLNINNVSTLDVGTTQTINRRTAGGTLTLATGAFMKLGASSGGQTGSNFPLNYSTINLNSAATPTSTVEYYGAAAQTIFSTPTYGNLTVSGNSTKTAAGALTIKGDAIINTTGDVFAGSTFNHSIAGNWYNNVSTTAFTSTGLVTFNGTLAQTIGGTSGSTFNNLTITNSAGVSIAQDENVNALLSLTLGNLNITNKNLIMGSTAPAIAGTFSSTRMIIADGGGQVRKNYSTNGSYIFPIGDNTGTPEYSPITLNYTSGTYAAGAYASVKVTNAKHPANNSTSDYINRYWSAGNSGITSPVYTVTSTYVPADVAGTEANISTGKYAGALPWTLYGPANTATHLLSAAAITNTGSVDITGISKGPTVAISGGGVALCLGSSTGLTTTVTGGTSVITYAWTGQGLSSSTAANITVTPASIGSQPYTVVVTDQNGLTATAATTISVSDPAVLVTAPVSASSCAGSDVIFNVAATGTGLNYQWQVSTDNGGSYSNITAAPYSGFNTNSLTITAPSFSMSGYLYRVIITPASPCNIITTTGAKLSFRNLWTGTTSIEWNNGANWSDGNVASLTCPDVTIPGGTTFQPTLGSGTATINNLHIQAAGNLTVTNGVLQIAGSITNAGIFDVSNGTIEFNGTSAQSIPVNVFATNKIKNLVISNTVSLDGVDSLTGAVSFGSSNKTFATNGNLTIKSTISTTGSVGQVINGNAITGDVTVERYIATGIGSAPNHGKSWQLLAVPTFGSQSIKAAWQEGATATDIGSIPGSAGNPVPGYGTMITSNVANAATQPNPGFDVFTAAGPTVKVYDSVSASYFGPASTSVPVYNQKGYFVFVRGDRSVYTSNGVANPTILRTKGPLFTPANLPPVSNVAANLFQSVGNPYASAIDMRNITFAGGVTEFFQVWDPRLGGSYNYGAFQTFSFDGTNYTVTPGGGSYGPAGTVNNYIQSGQAFLVQAFGSSGTVSFNENCKANGSSLFTTPNPVNQAVHALRTSLNTVNADGSTGSVVDGVLSQFDDTYNNAIDGMDARKMTNTGENLGIKTAGRLLSIERKHTITSRDTIFLNITSERNQPYRFRFDAENLDPSVQGYVVDNFTNTRTPLNMTGTTDVDFTVTGVAGSNAANRFMIVFEPLKALPVTFTSIKAYKQDKDIDVEWAVDNEVNMKQYEVEKSTDGAQFTTIATKAATANNGGSAVYVVADVDPVEGFNYYRVKSVDINGKISYTNVVKVTVGSVKQDISIYPNPITDGVIHLQLMNEPAGKYDIRMLNKLGQLITQKQITDVGGNATELIKWDYNLAHGMYQLEVTGPGGISSTISVMY